MTNSSSSRRLVAAGLAIVIVILAISVSNTNMSSIFSSGENLLDRSDQGIGEVQRSVVATEEIRPTEIATLVPLEILAVCSGIDAVVNLQSCRDRYIAAGDQIGLGEMLIIIPSRSVTGSNTEFDLDQRNEPISFDDIDAAVAQLETNSSHSIRVRESGGDWSPAFDFNVGFSKPGKPMIVSVCSDMVCSPPDTLFAPISDMGGLYPVIVQVMGLASDDNQHLWVELSLDGNENRLGCINCSTAFSRGFQYPERLQFGDTQLFYNWDLAELEPGQHYVRARLRNLKLAGDWSNKFYFDVLRE